MQTTTTALTVPLRGVREGNSYVMTVTGATQTVALEFQHVDGGSWFPLPGYSVTPAAGVIHGTFVAPCSRMRATVAAGQVTPWTVSWTKQTYEKF